ncbi:HEPN domain-containing protein [bacterium]|nr:HEPN domain-containing protein [bacterium]
MNETVREWIEKADADFATAERELAVLMRPNYDAVCYHAQQSIEKLMKGLIIHFVGIPSRTHRLLKLHEELAVLCPSWDADREGLRLLSRAAVDFRYPGEKADFDEANEAIETCKELRAKLMPFFDN